VAEFSIAAPTDAAPVTLKVDAGGDVVRLMQIDGPAWTPIRVVWQGEGSAYVEVSGRTTRGAPAPFDVGVRR
jgi:hypothetical protein